MNQTKSPADFRLLSEETLSEPYEFWSALRHQAPVHRVDEGIGYTIVSRYEDVTTALRDVETFSSELSRRFKGGVSAYEDSPVVKEVMADACPYVGTLNFTDGEPHAAQRRAVRRGFTVARVKQLDEIIDLVVDELLDTVPFNEEVDLWTALCVPLPIRMITHILGLDPDHAPQVKAWGDAQVARFGGPREDEEANLETARRIVEMHQYLIRELDAREQVPRDDFLSDLVAGGTNDISRGELVLICAQLIVAGAESTASLIGSMLDRLVANPDQMALLRADRSLIPAAVEETLRAESPIKAAYRFTTRDVELGGQVIPANTVVLLLLGSADRDDDAFADAERFDLTRTDPARHVAFGMGAHLCSGAALARSEGQIVMNKILDRTSDIRRAGADEPHHDADLTVRALHSLPLVLVPADGGGASA